MDRRTELKAQYKNTYIPAGILMIKNTANGKMFVAGSRNLKGLINKYKMCLKTGSCMEKEMVADYKKFDPESFIFEVLETIPQQKDPDFDYYEEVEILTEIWLEKLQPYGENGYNKLKTKK